MYDKKKQKNAKYKLEVIYGKLSVQAMQANTLVWGSLALRLVPRQS